MSLSRLVVVTATTNYARAKPCMDSWGAVPIITIANGPNTSEWRFSDQPPESVWEWSKEYLGTVAAFKTGVDYVLDHMPEVEVIANLHDDVILQDPDWVEKVLRRFDQTPACGLLGFGGAIGVGDSDIYQKPYQPMQLARIGFRSNLQDAEVHGIRSLLPERVACLDGFSQVGRRQFWEGRHRSQHAPYSDESQLVPLRPWNVLNKLGVHHHAYDGMLGCLAARYGWECWYLPIRAKHLGGQTAVGDEGYQRWASTQTAGGDHGFWEQAHETWWKSFKDVLPIRL